MDFHLAPDSVSPAATRAAVEIGRFVHRWAGADVPRDGPVQRFFRDVHAGTQHAGSSAAVTQECGRMLSGMLPADARWGFYGLVVPPADAEGEARRYSRV